MRTMLLASSILLGGGCLAGCSSTLLAPLESKSPMYQVSESAAASQQALASVKVCCTRLDEIRATPLATDKTEYYVLNARSPVFPFATGKSFFQALEIPDTLNRATFTLAAMAGPTVFVPTVLILDENFRVIRAIPASRFAYVPAGFLEPQRLQGQFSIDRREGQGLEKYLLVFTTDEDLRGATPMISEARLYARARGLADPGLPDPVAQHAATGVFRIAVSNVQTASPVDRRYVSDTQSARRYIEPAGGTSGTATVTATHAQSTASGGSPTMLSETQSLYDRLIREAVREGDMDRAWRLVGEAERAGSTSARQIFMEAVARK